MEPALRHGRKTIVSGYHVHMISVIEKLVYKDLNYSILQHSFYLHHQIRKDPNMA